MSAPQPIHLSHLDQINLGSFYTPAWLVQRAFDMLCPYIDPKDYYLLDSACGYGSFLTLPGFHTYIGMDCDLQALHQATQICPHVKLVHQNALHNVSRESFYIPSSAKLVIMGNPPYNDRTSRVRSALKDKTPLKIDTLLQARDVGLSFLRSFALLEADYICVLHPLSYLIKRTNLRALKNFAQNYRLLDSLLVSSRLFCPKSLSYFPIILALYKRDSIGMDETFISHFSFKSLEGSTLRLSDWDFISAYVDKYPNQQRVQNKSALFYTLRDINALARSKTFLSQESAHAIYVPPEKYSLYCYIDVFKTQISHIPYYLRNCEVFLDFARFKALEEDFIHASQNKTISPQITRYFCDLLGDHYL
ncbi:SAM-dependent methyltransferase [Helicobacter cynogastricus]|uniref:SAM-dependent methyltransferase n=1 Tax=Helicobacter cynogastricus TaxID=329937 RepID=UPI000CF13B30|nr:SAM-dependent methyltransferase [Helicobacter cynogastricus]